MAEWIEYNKPLKSAGAIKAPGLTISASRNNRRVYRLNPSCIDAIGNPVTFRFKVLMNPAKGFIGLAIGEGSYIGEKSKLGGSPVRILSQVLRDHGIELPEDLKFIPALIGEPVDGKKQVICFDISKWWKGSRAAVA